MKKKSISNECLALEALRKLNQPKLFPETNRSKSEEKLDSNFLHVPHGKVAVSSSPSSSRVLSRLFKFKNKSATTAAARKNSILVQTTALLDYDTYDELNVKLDMIKQSVMENLNKLKERDVSLQDLEMKADYLSQHALNLNMVSTNIKKQQKATKMNVKYIMLVILVVFVGISTVYSYLLYSGISKGNS